VSVRATRQGRGCLSCRYNAFRAADRYRTTTTSPRSRTRSISAFNKDYLAPARDPPQHRVRPETETRTATIPSGAPSSDADRPAVWRRCQRCKDRRQIPGSPRKARVGMVRRLDEPGCSSGGGERGHHSSGTSLRNATCSESVLQPHAAGTDRTRAIGAVLARAFRSWKPR